MLYIVHLHFRLGEGCSHVAAIMFKVECAVRQGYTSTTSQLCKWNETFCHKVSSHPRVCVRTLCQVNVMSEVCHALFIPPFQIEPSLVVNIPFQRPKRGRDIGEKPSRPMKVMRSKPHSIAMEDIFLRELQQISPSSVVFSSLPPLSRAIHLLFQSFASYLLL